MTSKAVSFKNITKKYGETTVLKNICLDINDHETTALVGESGSGKTTLLQLVNGLTLPSAGEVNIFGDQLDYDNLANARKRMGYAVQGAGLFPHMTIFENIIVMAKLDGWNDQKIAARADYVVELVDLKKELLDRFPHNLSGGQQQRVSLCRAMMLNPSLLLLDEPFSALDPITKQYIHAEFLKLQKTESKAILLVTHDMEEAVKLADNIVIIKDGEVVQSGKIPEITEAPKDDYVRGLLTAVTS